ncbi:hypothetical protein [Rhodococcoides fascians]|uniref:hypothetical protein n=1 Tax=Rhodococcoides fascians TaxID=1828 RepID=UPI00055F67B9|nr:hypothetical protein [Rhodococcus fascians]
MTSYTLLKGLAGIYLEDSYVLSIEEAPERFTFSLDTVLTPDSPRYQPPKPGEQYCYARGRIVFEHVTAVNWVSRSSEQYTDATGAVDLGNIDSLSFERGVYLVRGDWGCVRVQALTEPLFIFD